MAVKVARVDAPNVAAMATSANAPGETSGPGSTWLRPVPASVPNDALINRIGASVPPDVPEPEREPPADQLHRAEDGNGRQRELAVEHVADRVVADAECPRREETDAGEGDGADDGMPELAERQPPVAGLDEEQAVADDDAEHAAREAEQHERRQAAEARVVVDGHLEERSGAEQGVVHPGGHARGDDQRHEGAGGELEQQSSTARITAASGEPKVADMPAAAPQASRILRSAGDTRTTWPSSEPIAPPVTMIGPSAPNGAAVPMATAADTGLATAVRGAIRLCFVSTASIASGMPCPRMTGDHFASRVDDQGAEHGNDDHSRRWRCNCE